MAKKKQHGGTIAIPFLVTTLIALILMGIPALYYYNKITQRNEEIMNNNESKDYIAKAEDSGNILFVLDFDDESLVNTYFVLHTDPLSRKFVLVPFLNSTSISYNGKTSTVDEIYSNSGIETLKSAVASSVGVEINKHMKLDDASFQKLCDILGGASYNVPSGLKGFNAGEQYLSSEQIQSLITHYAFADEEQRVYYAGGVLTAMLNQTLGERIAGNIDTNFNSVMNVVSDTDIASMDFTAVRNIIIYMFEDDKYTAQFKNPTGSWNNGVYELNSDEIAEVKEWLSANTAEDEE